jgi:hypothetical protein
MPCENWLEWVELQFRDKELLRAALKELLGQDIDLTSFGFVEEQGQMVLRNQRTAQVREAAYNFGGMRQFGVKLKLAYSQGMINRIKSRVNGVVTKKQTAKETVIRLRY